MNIFCCCSVTKSCLTLRSQGLQRAGSPILTISRSLLKSTVSDAISSSHPLLPPSPFAFNLSLYQDLFQWVGSLYQVAKVLELQLQRQSFQWIFRVDFLENILWSKLRRIPISSPWSPDTVKINRSNTETYLSWSLGVWSILILLMSSRVNN